MSNLFTPFRLPGGATVPNRIVKAAMEESLATASLMPDKNLARLYRTWARGGAGTLITGNVMVHDAAVTGTRDVVLDERQPLEPFRQWARATHEGGAKIWMQISHPGRQVRADQPGVAWAPSAKAVEVGPKNMIFPTPTPMNEEQIQATIARFITTARRAEEAGFDGVEIHAAHGYLLSQFLSPLANTRTDRWGGSLENRARLLLEIVRGIRAAVAPDFAVTVKLNSADFQRGGFEIDDARAVIAMLAPLGVDLVELSGGSYESPAMTGRAADSRTHAREAYFLDMARNLLANSPIPLMVTGGIVRPSVAEEVLDSGAALVGIGTALAADPHLPRRWEAGQDEAPEIPRTRIKNKGIASLASMAWVRWQMTRIAQGKEPKLGIDPRVAMVAEQVQNKRAGRRYASWLNRRLTEGSATPRKVLMVVTAARVWTLKDGSEHPTGFWGEELAVPHELFTKAGWEVTIATPGGVAPTLDELSMGISGGLPSQRRKIRAYLDSIADLLAHPAALEEIKAEEYDLVFYPGGHGPMEDLAFDATSGALLRQRLEAGAPLALLCHAPAAILAATTESGGNTNGTSSTSNAFDGRRMTGLSNREEHLNPFAWKAKWLLEDEMKKAGVEYSAGFPLRSHVVVDRNLYSGQNPQSSRDLALRIIADLG
ncbi:DJ-1/PfpI family protein [Corynebacterium sp. 22KM0430]|uniref:oxidoreductase n=1 Tax=Corynebacterium sp. 22KM0430 TaxID=2989735 RepID=UPI0029CA35CC|nr:DJ-1/PfpI family protein [Corynebacterium sp. 22KM0430]